MEGEKAMNGTSVKTKAEPVWAVMAASLFDGNMNVIGSSEWDEQLAAFLRPEKKSETCVVDCAGLHGKKIINNIKFMRRCWGSGSLIIKISKASTVRMLLRSACGYTTKIAYGVMGGYYTSHIPIGCENEKNIIRYCMGMGESHGSKNRIKGKIKKILLFLNQKQLFYDYYIVLLEGCDEYI